MEIGSYAEFLVTLFGAVTLWNYQSADTNNKATEQIILESKYDFIIVGAGSAGILSKLINPSLEKLAALLAPLVSLDIVPAYPK